MRSRLIPVLWATLVLAGCSATAHLYPIEGPLSTQTPVPVYVGKMTAALKSGEFSFTLSDGEICKGRWQLVPRPNSPKAASAANSAPVESMSREWDAVYGTGFYVSHVLGSRLYGRGVLAGNRGTDLNVEVFKPDKPEDNALSNIKGVAKDTKGNIFKLTF
jgi:hypothetical protein